MKKIFQAFVVLLVVSFSLSTFLVPQAERAEATENSWANMAEMPTARTGLGVVVVNGKIYAIGGYGKGYLDINEEYYPATNNWTTKKSMPTARTSFGIAAYQNKIYVIGGSNRIEGSTGANEVYDPSTDTWETKTSMPTNRSQLNANVVNGKIYLIGGRTGGQYTTVSLNEVYDPSTDSWTTKAAIPYPVVEYASAVVDNKIYVIGGQDEFHPDVNMAFNQIYDTETNTWSLGASIPVTVLQAAAGATTDVLAPKKIYVISGRQNLDPVNLNQIYNLETDTWNTGNSIPTPRSGLAVAVVNDVLYAIGGVLGWLKPITAVNEQYTPIGFGTVPPDTMPPTISIISPENKTYFVNNVSLTFTFSKAASWMGYSLDGQDNVTITGKITLTGLPDGPHSLVVYATDTAGNTRASETIYFSIVSPPPDLNGEIFLVTNWILWGIIIIAVVGAALLFYFRKIRKKAGKTEE